MPFSPVTGFDWAKIKTDIAKEEWEECEGSTSRRGIYLGSILLIMPSGKYYMPWACSNVTEEEAAKDEAFLEALESEAEEAGLSLESGEGNPLDMFAYEYR